MKGNDGIGRAVSVSVLLVGMALAQAQWQASPNLPVTAAQLDPVINAGRVYVAGGFNGANLNGIHSGVLGASGAVQAWSTIGQLPQADPGPGLAVYNGWLYAVLANGAVVRAAINADGSLGSWVSEQAISLSTAGYSGAVKVYRDNLYVFGRFEGSPRNVVRFAPIQADGSLGAWRDEGLPAPIFDGAIQFFNDRVYLAGGVLSSTVWQLAYSTGINTDGSFTGWRAEAMLPVALRAHGCVLVDNRMLLLGGVTNNSGGINTQVFEGQISTTDGKIAVWNAVDTMPGEFAANAGAVYAAATGRVYVTGGANGIGNFTAEVWSKVFGTASNPNTAPVANAQSVTVDQNGSVNIELSGSDADGDALTFAIVTGPAHGTLSGSPPSLVYQPAADYVGPDAFTFKANDGQADSAPATVGIEVQAVNRPPVANGQSVTAPAGALVAITLTGSDPDGDALTYTIVGMPAHGTLGGTAPQLTYVAEADYVGADALTFKVNDGQVDSAVATVTIDVQGEEQLDPLAATKELAASVANSSIERQRKQPLLVSLDAAAKSLTKGNKTPAIGQLQAFQSKLKAQIARTDPPLAREWYQQAQDIIDELRSAK